MDPTACFERFVEAVVDGDQDEAKAALVDLKGWLDKGGFAADWPKGTVPDGFVFWLCAHMDII